MSRSGRRTRTAFLWAVSIVLLVVIVGAVWINQVMQGERDAALEVWRNDAITVSDTGNAVVLEPADDGSGIGLVYVPGAKVDPYAYMYKLSAIVEDGYTVVITKPTLNLALADLRPLDDFTGSVPGISRWVVGGHSLGGVKACQYANENSVVGLALFGSYCATDLSASGVPVLSFEAANDGLSTPQKIADAAGSLPENTVRVRLAGANHADFGDYGVQPGDGESRADDADIRRQFAESFRAWVMSIEN